MSSAADQHCQDKQCEQQHHHSKIQFQLKSFSKKLRHFTLYESDHRYYLVGCDVAQKQFRLLKLEKQVKYVWSRSLSDSNYDCSPTTTNTRDSSHYHHDTMMSHMSHSNVASENSCAFYETVLNELNKRSSSLVISEDAGIYTRSQMRQLLHMIHLSCMRSSGNGGNGGGGGGSYTPSVNTNGNGNGGATGNNNSGGGGSGGGDASTSGRGLVKRLSNAHGIIGFIKFTHGYYLILITEKKSVGTIACHSIYEISKTELVPLFITVDVNDQYLRDYYYANMRNVGANGAHPRNSILERSIGNMKRGFWLMNQASSFLQRRLTSLHKDDEQKYKEIFMGLDLSKDFYFSYTYDLTSTLQMNMSMINQRNGEGGDTVHEPQQQQQRQKSMFEWNSFLMKPFKEQVSNGAWLLPIVHGHFGESKLSVFGKIVNIVLIGRRSRYFAGTRYLKRGISDNGYVANHVEAEQILYDQDSLYSRQSIGSFSSFVQTRGSIPLYWSQAITTKVVNPKPEIVFSKFDPLYASSAKHFDQLMDRYGAPVCCLDVVKRKEKKPKEQLLGEAYRVCINFLNQNLPPDRKVRYTAWDFRRAIKDTPEKALNELATFAEENFEATGMFCSKSLVHKEGYCLQSGVLRTNCIDCLDRTNIVQFFVGKLALGHQLYAMGISDSPHLIQYIDTFRILMELYDQMGDKIALQYGGSRTVSAGLNHRGYSWDILTSLTRYYSNNFKDTTRQHAMNLFLGNFVPNSQQNLPPIWNLDTDTYLHDNDKSDVITVEDNSLQPDNSEQVEEYYEEAYGQHRVSDLEGRVESNDFIANSGQTDNNRSANSTAVTTNRNNTNNVSNTTRNEPINDTVQSSEANNTASPMETDASKRDMDIDADDTFDYLSTEYANQSALLNFFEGKMNTPYLVQPCMTRNESFVAQVSKDLIHYQKENQKVVDVMKHEERDLDLLKSYVNEYSGENNTIPAVPQKTTRRTINNKKRVILEPSNTELVSSQSLQSKTTYEAYMQKFSPKKENLIKSEILTKDYVLYQQYPTYKYDFKQKHEQYQKFVMTRWDNDQDTSSNLATNSYAHSNFKRLQPYFPNLKSNRELSQRIAFIAHKMKSELTTVDRVRHPRPAKKMFSQIGLLELIKGRLYHLCFLGYRGIDWVIQNSGSDAHIQKRIDTREDAKQFMQVLLEASVFHHVSFAKVFLDGHYLYNFTWDDPTCVLNMHQIYTNEARLAIDVSIDAMTKITDIYRELFQVDHKALSFKNRQFFSKLAVESRNVIQSNKFKRFLEVLCELQRVDLQLLSHQHLHERICFFLNIYNVLLLHGLLISSLISDCKIHGLATHSFYRRTCYQIAGFKFSLTDIRDGVLRNNKCYPNTFIPVFDSIDGVDPRLRFCIQPKDVRILFLLDKVDRLWNNSEYITIPGVNNEQQIDASAIYQSETIDQYQNVFSCLEPEKLEFTLQGETEDFCMHRILIDPRNRRIRLPSLFGVYCEDFGGSDMAVLQACYHLMPPSSLLHTQLAEIFEAKQTASSFRFDSEITGWSIDYY